MWISLFPSGCYFRRDLTTRMKYSMVAMACYLAVVQHAAECRTVLLVTERSRLCPRYTGPDSSARVRHIILNDAGWKHRGFACSRGRARRCYRWYSHRVGCLALNQGRETSRRQTKTATCLHKHSIGCRPPREQGVQSLSKPLL